MRAFVRFVTSQRCAAALILLLLLCFSGGLAQSPATEGQKPVPSSGQPPAASAPASPQADQPSPTSKPAASETPEKGKKGNKSKQDPTGGSVSATDKVDTKPYEIGPEDILYVNVFHNTDVTGQVDVRPDGFVSIRFAGEIKAAGLTTEQLSAEVSKRLTQYFNHPEVNIQVMKINSKKYYVSGEIRRPGSYPLTAPKTVFEGIVDAGGPADFAKLTKIYVLRGSTRLPFNFKDVSRGKRLEQNVLLQNGDHIIVP
jgi:polysaccharide export outer membrane protein